MVKPSHGLVTLSRSGSPVFLPLKSSKAKVLIADVSARVVLTQIYKNDNPNALSAAQYIFPVPVNAAVCALYMDTTNGQRVKAVVKALSKAKTEFNTAIAKDEWAGILYQSAGDVLVLSVGAIPAQQNIRVTIFYVTELEEDEQVHEVRFQLPTYITQRYGAAPQESSKYGSSTNSTAFDVEVDVTMADSITAIRSSTHKIRPTITNNTAVVRLDKTAPAALNKEFVLTIGAQGLNKPRLIAEVDQKRNSVALSLTMVPQFRGQADLNPQEIIFVVDRSGSMRTHDRIKHAKAALIQFVAKLPSNGCYFNIVSFGNTHSSLWKTSNLYDSRSRKAAESHIDKMTANYGGTKIRNALMDVISKRRSGMPTSVIILTDGAVGDTETNHTITTIRNAVANSGTFNQGKYLRFFTLGVGESASTALCKGIADAGRGLCYMTAQSEETTRRVAYLLQAARKPPIASALKLRVEWRYTGNSAARAALSGGGSSSGVTSIFDESYDMDAEENSGTIFKLPPPPDVQQAPSDLREFANMNRFIVNAIMADTQRVPSSVKLVFKLADGTEQFLAVPVVRIPPVRPPLIHTLAARRIIRELESGNITSLKPAVKDNGDKHRRAKIAKAASIKFSENYQVVGRHTAFVAVKKGDGGDDADEYDLGPDALATIYDEEQAFMNQQQTQTLGDIPGSLQPFGSFTSSGSGSRSPSSSRVPDPPRVPASPRMPAPPRAPPSRTVPLNINFEEVQPAAIPSRAIPLPVAMPPQRFSDSASIIGSGRELSLDQPVKKDIIIKNILVSVESDHPDDTITQLARLQAFDGSFALDDSVVSLLQQANHGITIQSLATTIPRKLKESWDADPKVLWATMLVCAFLKTRLASEKVVWDAIFEKSKEYVMAAVNGGQHVFSEILDEAINMLHQ